MTGPLICFEGIDGSGKSTMVRRIADTLTDQGRTVSRIATREADLEQVFESVVTGYRLDETSPEYMFLFQMLHASKAHRAQEALTKGHVVIADRWDLSFFVYHSNFGFFASESAELRAGISNLAFRGLVPDLGIYLDVTVDEAFDRRKWRGEDMKEVEKEREFYTQVTESYRDLAQQRGWVIVEANDGFEGVAKEVWALVEKACN